MGEFQTPARFWRCDLQTHSPLEREFTPGVDPGDPKAIKEAASRFVAAALNAGLDVVALTDHNSTSFIDPLRKAADDKLVVFPGIEISAADGYHVLCLFDPTTPVDHLDALLIRLGIDKGKARHDDGAVCLADERWTFAEVLKEVDKCGGICIAPHVRRDHGLLHSPMAGDIRVRNWLNPLLLAVEDDQAELKPGNFADKCMLNTLKNYKRVHPVARVWGSDAKSYSAIGSSQTLIKMVEPSVEGLRQAFLDPGSRIRHPDAFELAARDRIESIHWDGGFLNGTTLSFSEQLNCLIGGKGTGKSTVIESLRFALGMDVPTDAPSYQRLIDSTLPPGTKVSVKVVRRDGAEYSISRTQPYEPEIVDVDGDLLSLSPTEVFSVDVYSQGQILDTARQPVAHLALLDSFVQDQLSDLREREEDLLRKLAENRRELVEATSATEQLDEDRATIRRLQEARKVFDKKGVARRTELRRSLDNEQRLVKAAQDDIDALRRSIAPLADMPTSPELFSDTELPHKSTWKPLGRTWGEFRKVVDRFVSETTQLLSKMEQELRDATAPNSPWAKSVRTKREDVARVYRELQDEFPELDLGQFERIDRQLAELTARTSDPTVLEKRRARHRKQRARLLSELRDSRRQQFRTRDDLAKSLTKSLGGAVRIEVQFQAQREEFVDRIVELKTKVRREALTAMVDEPACTPEALGDALVSGAKDVEERFGLTATQATALVERISLDQKLALQEFSVPDAVSLEFNLANVGETPRYRDLARLSVGQKATTILLILLAQAKRPLIIDQPEDDLDNRFIYKDVVERLRTAKDDRQLILATHNANIPVLGDGELIAVLEAEESSGQPVGHLEGTGSIDTPGIKESITQILEGGQEAFSRRQRKYGSSVEKPN